jgi:3',5'-nucleoside bisphosphate phosphatase
VIAGTSRTGSARADLHTHSTASDGLLAPARLIQQASERGLSVLALTDHDTTMGLDEALAAGRRHGVRVIAGIELSTDVEHGQMHMLGYGIDRHEAGLLSTLEALRASRRARAQQIVDRLRALGIDVDPAAVRPTSSGEAVGRPHVARAMVAAGHVTSVREAFDRYIGEGRPAYVASRRLSPPDAARLIAKAGGIPVLAHPFTFPRFREEIPPLIDAGLQGIEVYYGEYTGLQIQELEDIADRYQLLKTGGSDYHGEGVRNGRGLGESPFPDHALERFLEHLDSLARSAD